MSKKNKTVTHLDKVIIILSFLYKHDLELLRNFIMNMKMSKDNRETLLNRISQKPLYHVDDIQKVLKDFYSLTRNEALLNPSNELTSEISINLATEASKKDPSVTRSHLFGDIDNDILLSFLDTQGLDIKGLLCHMLSYQDLKDLFNLLDTEEIGSYLKAFHSISPTSPMMLETFKQFLITRIQSGKQSEEALVDEKNSQFVEMLEVLGKKAIKKIENVEVNNLKIKQYKTYFLHPKDIKRFNDEDKKMILSQLLSMELLPKFLKIMSEEDQVQILQLLSQRNKAIMEEELELFVEELTDEEVEDVIFEFISIVRQLQSTNQIDNTVKRKINLNQAEDILDEENSSSLMGLRDENNVKSLSNMNETEESGFEELDEIVEGEAEDKTEESGFEELDEIVEGEAEDKTEESGFEELDEIVEGEAEDKTEESDSEDIDERVDEEKDSVAKNNEDPDVADEEDEDIFDINNKK